MSTRQTDYTPRHAAGTGRHRSGESVKRNERVGGYTPTHGRSEASTRKRTQASLRTVKARNKGERSVGSLFSAIWALGNQGAR